MTMTSPDMDVIKEIPGYKVILKAVLKSQIQQLVEQLASSTDEESVILTASVADGTLCHLGSNSGKVFLEDHEDIKSQFLGFCLKRHHAEKRDKERKEAQDRDENLARNMQGVTSPNYGNSGMSYMPPHGMPSRYPSPGQYGQKTRMRSPGVRHLPYSTSRPMRHQLKPNSSPFIQSDGQMIKTEPSDDNENSNSQTGDTGQNPSNSSDSSPPVSPFAGLVSSSEPNSESLSSNVLPDTSALDSSNLSTNVSSVSESGNDSLTNAGLDPNITVKLESVNNPDMDLEITGVELSHPASSVDWTANPQNIGQGAAGTLSDMTDQQGFLTSLDTPGEVTNKYHMEYSYEPSGHLHIIKKHPCEVCGKVFKTNWERKRHEKVHTGERPFKCEICDFRCSQRHHLKSHLARHLVKI